MIVSRLSSGNFEISLRNCSCCFSCRTMKAVVWKKNITILFIHGKLCPVFGQKAFLLHRKKSKYQKISICKCENFLAFDLKNVLPF